MYNQENQGFSVRDILIQIMFIILFVFIMIWLFPTKSNMEEQNNKLDVLTGNIFNTNILTMKDAAVSYYTTNRLPKTLNAKEKMTLKEMLDKKLLVEFVDGKGNKCDINASYVEVIKLEDEYQMKISLTCTDNDAYIIVHLGCYDYCKALSVCEKDEPVEVIPNVPVSCKYEYEKISGGKWGNYGNWSAWSVNAVSNTDYRVVETKVEKVKSGTETVQTGTRVETVNPECPTGYTRNGAKCSKTTTDTKTATCPTGYNLSNGTCYGNGTKVEYKEPTCPTGYGNRNGNTCYKTTSSTDTKDATCPTGYKLSGTTCTMTTPVVYSRGSYIGTYTGSSLPASDSKYTYETVSVDYVYDCNDECAMKWVTTYKKYNTVVSGGETKTTDPTCPTGYTRNGSKCYKTSSSTQTASAICATGTLKNGKCEVTVGKVVTEIPTCPTGYTRSVNTCTKSNTDTKSATCPTSYNMSGTTCSKTVPTYTTRDIFKDVTYYRYKERSYISGTRVTEWSTSQNDTKLVNAGYKLTGNKQCS